MTTVDRGIVIAAGRGHRLVNGSGIPKPLVQVAGRPLIDHVLSAFERAGLREAVVVVGYLGHMIRDALAGRPGIPVTVVDNPDWHKSNGVSVLAASRYVDGPCILSMSDHLYDFSTVRALCKPEQFDGECYLAVDDGVSDVFDFDDATKVRRSNGRIVEIGKELAAYDGIDTGVFRIGPSLVESLRRVYESRGDCSLSDGVRLLCEAGRMCWVPVGNQPWLDVDTPEALRYAEAVFRLREDQSRARAEAGGAAESRGDGRRSARPLPTWTS